MSKFFVERGQFDVRHSWLIWQCLSTLFAQADTLPMTINSLLSLGRGVPRPFMAQILPKPWRMLTQQNAEEYPICWVIGHSNMPII